MGVWSKLRLRVFCPIWKNPWMAFNADTYAHDVLRMLGYNNIYRVRRRTLSDDHAGRRASIASPDIVLLPDEPYEFADRDIEELRAGFPPGLSRRIMIVSGRDLHWYGVHMVEGLKSLAARLARVRAAVL